MSIPTNHNFWILLLFIISVVNFIHGEEAKKKTEMCGDNVKGACGAGFYGWCYFDKNGTYGCDAESYCANKQSLRGKMVAACFEDNTRCCCNNGDMCNMNFIKKNPDLSWTHTCTAALAEPAAEVQWKDCGDAYCYTIAYQESGTRLRSLIQGCQYQMHTFAKQWKANDENKGYVISKIAQKYSCYDIVQSGKECIELETKTDHDGKTYTATLCCCGAGLIGNRTKCNDEYINPAKREEAVALGLSMANSSPDSSLLKFWVIFLPLLPPLVAFSQGRKMAVK